MINFKKEIKIIFINIGVLVSSIIGCLIVLEVSLQLKAIIRNFSGGERTQAKYCYDEIIKPYGYCSLIIHKKNVENENLDYKSVDIFVDRLGGRVDSKINQNVNPNIYNNFLIGDSYVQADEIPVEKTIQGLSRLNKNESDDIYGIGVGSWNTNQYLQVVKQLNKPNARFSIFISPNDLFPNFSLSSLRQSNNFFLKYSRSIKWIYGKLRFIIIKAVNTNHSEFQRVLDKAINTEYKDCSAFNSKDYLKIKYQTRTDHLIFSKHHSCWPDFYKKSVDHSINELKMVSILITDKNSDIRGFIIPFSISFVNEQTKGRMFSNYRYPSSKAVSHKGLSDYLTQNLPFQVIDLEPVFEKELLRVKNNCSSCDNHFYLKNDGHFTPLAHKFIYDKYFK